MHDLVAAHPKVQAILQRREQRIAAHQTAMKRIDAAKADHERVMADWRQKVADAHRAGKEPPPRPAALDLGGDEYAYENFMRERQALDTELRATLVEIAPELEAAFAAWEDQWAARARKAVAEMQRLTAEMADALTGVRELRTAVDSANPNERPMNGTAARTRQSVTAHDVIDAIAGGIGLLAPEPPSWRGEVVCEQSGYQLVPGRLVSGTPPDMRPPRRDGVARI